MPSLRDIRIVGILVAAGVLSPIAQVTEQVRTVAASQGRKLSELTRQGEQRLIVSSLRSRPFEIPPPIHVPTVEWLFRGSDVVMVAWVDDVLPTLTPAEDWITSQISMSVLEILKGSDLKALRAGDRVTFEQDGGDMVIGRTQVSARLPWAREMGVGQRHLVFMVIDPSARAVVVGPTSIYEMTESGRLERLAKPLNGPDGIETSPAATVIDRIRELARNRSVSPRP